MNIIERSLYKLLPNLNKLNKLAEAIDNIETDERGSVVIRYKKNVTVLVNGHMLTNVKGINIHNSTLNFVNPNMKNKNKSNIANAVGYCINKASKYIDIKKEEDYDCTTNKCKR